MQCELCGISGRETYPVIFEGRKIYACINCIKEYKLVRIKKVGARHPVTQRPVINRGGSGAPTIKPRKKRGLLSVVDDMELKEDYGDIIKRARESLGLTQKDLAFKLKTKLSVIRRLEAGRLVPPPDLVKKLEKTLNISLYEKVSVEVDEYISKDSDVYIRLGDLLRESED